MNQFQKAIWALESTQDVHNAIGANIGNKLLRTKKDPAIHALHDKVFGSDHHHEIELYGKVPKKITSHVKSNGDEISSSGHEVKLKSGRSVPTSKYLAKSGAAKDVKDEYENHARNDKGPNTKLVISRHPGEVASCSTGTHWNSCARLSGNGPAKNVMPSEIKHGTMIAMHVNKDAKKNKDGEYDAKDVLGRQLIKRHDTDSGKVEFHPEDKTYGSFGKEAKEKTQKFADTHYNTHNDHFTSTKHRDLYNDDWKTTKINKNSTKEYLDKALDNKDSSVRRTAASHPDATKENLHKALDDIDPSVRASAARHRNSTKEHLDRVMNDKDTNIKFLNVYHKNASKEHLDHALEHGDLNTRKLAAGHENASKENLDKALDDDESYVRVTAASNKNATKENLDKALDDKKTSVREAAAGHQNASKENLHKALDDKDTTVRTAAANHLKASKEHLDKALDDTDPFVRVAAITHRNTTKEHLDKALDDKKAFVRTVAARHRKASKEHLHKAMNDDDINVRNAAKENLRSKGLSESLVSFKEFYKILAKP